MFVCLSQCCENPSYPNSDNPLYPYCMFVCLSQFNSNNLTRLYTPVLREGRAGGAVGAHSASTVQVLKIHKIFCSKSNENFFDFSFSSLDICFIEEIFLT